MQHVQGDPRVYILESQTPSYQYATKTFKVHAPIVLQKDNGQPHDGFHACMALRNELSEQFTSHDAHLHHAKCFTNTKQKVFSDANSWSPRIQLSSREGTFSQITLL